MVFACTKTKYIFVFLNKPLIIVLYYSMFTDNPRQNISVENTIYAVCMSFISWLNRYSNNNVITQ